MNVLRRFASTLTLLGLLILVVVPTHLILERNEYYRPQARGMVLGLYANDPNFDYGEPLKRMASLGVRAVSLQFIYYMNEFSSEEITPHPINSPTDENLRRTIRQARSLGMRVMLFPTLNLLNEAKDDKYWRGNIEPNDWELWWANYEAFNIHFARLAQEEAVEWYSVGTEMESSQRFKDRWINLIQSVKEVFKGKIIYSVNFDAHDSFDFGEALDVIGMNTYDPITKENDFPSRETIYKHWWWILYKARALEVRFKKPVIITEVGYASSESSHRDPWDFRSPSPPYPERQALLMEEALRVLQHWTEGEGIFYYLYGEDLKVGVRPGGPLDRTFSPWGKPTEALLRNFFAIPRWNYEFWRGPYPVPPSAKDYALNQILLGHIRRFKTEEIKVLPPWVLTWGQNHPEAFKALQEQVQQESILKN
ncbi:MAG: glycoside hydrolase family 113 [Holophagaceae bacterium]